MASLYEVNSEGDDDELQASSLTLVPLLLR